MNKTIVKMINMKNKMMNIKIIVNMILIYMKIIAKMIRINMRIIVKMIIIIILMIVVLKVRRSNLHQSLFKIHGKINLTMCRKCLTANLPVFNLHKISVFWIKMKGVKMFLALSGQVIDKIPILCC